VLARPHPALLDLAAGRPVRPIDDPDGLLTSARAHRMAGLLLTRLQSGDPTFAGVDQEVVIGEGVVVKAHTRRLWKALADVAARLGSVGVSFAVLKGITAEVRWYDRLGERQCSDLDLLLAPDDVARVEAVVDALHPRYRLRNQLGMRVEQGLQQGVTLRVDGVSVDLHLDALKLGIPARATRMIWDRTVPFPLTDGREVRILDAEAQLFHFLMHLCKDGFPFLLGYVDVVRIVEREQLDWAAIKSMASADGLDATAALTLDAVFDTLSLPSPRPKLASYRGSTTWRLLYPRALRLRGEQTALHRPGRLLLLPLTMRGRRREVMRWLCERLFPRRSSVAALYPDQRTSYGALFRTRARARIDRWRDRRELTRRSG
jgi:Uncharacterised nucleotidyltransferase